MKKKWGSLSHESKQKLSPQIKLATGDGVCGKDQRKWMSVKIKESITGLTIKDSPPTKKRPCNLFSSE